MDSLLIWNRIEKNIYKENKNIWIRTYLEEEIFLY